jgi:UMP-CMP kinase family protein
MSDNKYKVIFIIGPPGVGKNTQCDELVKKYNLIHFGAGDLLRAEAKKDTEEGKLITSLIKEGKIVPVKITCGLIKKAMDEKGKDKVFLIDGYPRNQANIDGWKEVFGDNYVLVTSIILDCDEDTLVKRLMERGKTSGRADDNIETIKKRFKTHKEESEPIVKELKKMGPFIEVKATGTPQEVFNDIVKELDEKIKKYVK